VQVEELYDLEQSTFEKLKPVYGLIFLFKWQKEEDNRAALEGGVPGVFFANQVISNACATQAIISILLNCQEISLGTELSNFKSFTMDLPSEMKGEAIGNSSLIREAHNSFGRAEPFMFEEKKTADEDDDIYHFIGYVPVNGALYELDGLKNGPILLGECTNANWLDKVRPAIQARIQKYSQKEIRFNLLGLIQNKKEGFTHKIGLLNKRKAAINSKLSGGATMDTSDEHEIPLPTSTDELKHELKAVESEIKDFEQGIQDEEARYAKWRAENVRRKHNYVPFVYNFLKLLAERGKLSGLMDSTTKAVTERNARQKAAKDKEKAEKKDKDAVAKAGEPKKT